MDIRDYTTIEQSKKLLELGLSKDTANMVYPCSIVRGKENGFLNAIFKESILYAMHTTIEEKEKSIPCWSLGALLKIMPDNFVELLKEGGMYRAKAEQKYVSCLAENPIDVVCEIVINLLEKGRIEKWKNYKNCGQMIIFEKFTKQDVDDLRLLSELAFDGACISDEDEKLIKRVSALADKIEAMI